MSQPGFWCFVCALFAAAHFITGNQDACATFCAAAFVIAGLSDRMTTTATDKGES